MLVVLAARWGWMFELVVTRHSRLESGASCRHLRMKCAGEPALVNRNVIAEEIRFN